MRDSRVFLQPPPVPLVSKGFAARDAQRGEQTIATDQPRLSGGEPRFFDSNQAVVMKNVVVNHVRLRMAYSRVIIVTESTAVIGVCPRVSKHITCETRPLEAVDCRHFCIVDIEDSEYLGHLHYIVEVSVQMAETNGRALVLGAEMRSDQGAEARAVNVVDVRHVQNDFLLPLGG